MSEFLWAPTRRGESWHVCEEAISLDGEVKLSVEQLSSVCRWCVTWSGERDDVRTQIVVAGKAAGLDEARVAAEAKYAVVRRMIDVARGAT